MSARGSTVDPRAEQMADLFRSLDDKGKTFFLGLAERQVARLRAASKPMLTLVHSAPVRTEVSK